MEGEGVFTGVYDSATCVHVVEAKEDLFCDLANQGHGEFSPFEAIDKKEEVLAEDFEDHADVCAVGAVMLEHV
jgi:hypothetical protein